MKKLITFILLLASLNISAQIKDPSKIRVTRETVDTCQGKTLMQLRTYYRSFRQVSSAEIAHPNVLVVEVDKFFIIAVVRSNYIQLTYSPKDDLCNL